MLSSTLVISFASSLLITVSAVPTAHVSRNSTPNDVNPSTSPPTSSTVVLVKNLTTTATSRLGCWPDHPGADPMGKANPITDPTDCTQAVMKMLREGPDREPLVWEHTGAWFYGSCGLFLVPSHELPIHRGTFSRNDIAQCAERIRLKCVNEKNGYRGGLVPIDAGVFWVALSGKPGHLTDIMLNTTLSE